MISTCIVCTCQTLSKDEKYQDLERDSLLEVAALTVIDCVLSPIVGADKLIAGLCSEHRARIHEHRPASKELS
jgi:hypothetical protein